MATDKSSSARGRVRVEPGAKRVRLYVGGVAIVDTTHPLCVWESPYYPTYYLPVADVRTEHLVPTATTAHSPSRGDAVHFTVKVGDDERIDAASQYRESPIEELRDHIRFDWDAIDAWFEEDEEVYTHARSPYTRIDILPTSRQVRVEMQGVVLADSPRALVLFETGLPARWYVPKSDVRMDLLVGTDTESHCPYKGKAEYWSVRAGALGAGPGPDDDDGVDIVWSYATPLPESERIAGYVSFFDDRVDLYVDGERAERPQTR